MRTTQVQKAKEDSKSTEKIRVHTEQLDGRRTGVNKELRMQVDDMREGDWVKQYPTLTRCLCHWETAIILDYQEVSWIQALAYRTNEWFALRQLALLLQARWTPFYQRPITTTR